VARVLVLALACTDGGAQAANVPYMVSVGNHENSAGNLAHFTERFRAMPSSSGTVATQNKPSTAPNNWSVDGT
jgi:hypothetical protein